MSDKNINELKKEKESTGYGKNYIMTLDNEKIFVKKIPCTKLEYDNQFNTSNLYNLPAFYNYGFGSAGINCFRELLMHIKTTNWVLGDQIENFPLMYHYRIIKNDNPMKKNIDMDKYITRWNNNQNIKKYVIARDNAEYEIMICLEYFPYVLYDWFKSNTDKTESYIKQVIKTTDFLKKHNVIHLDAHDGNIVTDGETFYLTDFGLVLDLEFELKQEEKDFYKKNDYYQYATVLDNILVPLFPPEQEKYLSEKYNLNNDTDEETFIDTIYKNLDEICEHLNYKTEYCDLLKKYWSMSKIYRTFEFSMRHNNNKNDVFPNNDIEKLLYEISHNGGYYYKYQKYKTKYMQIK
jgi:serine/threonine protein kinase